MRAIALLNIKLFALFFIGFALAIVFSTPTKASEGVVELTNRVGEDARCWAPSVLMPDQTYEILISCRDIIYPGGTEVFNYVMWARPITGGNPVRLGTLELGKRKFRTQTAYDALFVTKERQDSVRAPEGTIVMQGLITRVSLLDPDTTPKPTAQPGQSPAPDEVDGSPVATQAPQGGIAKFLAGGIVTILGIAGILFVIFVVMRK